MKLFGFLLLVAGWLLVLAAIVLLKPSSPALTAFVLAGLAVELIGLGLTVRAHILPRREHA